MNAPTNITDPLVLFMPSGKCGGFPVGTPLLEAARSLSGRASYVCGVTRRRRAAILQIAKPPAGAAVEQ